MDKKENLVLRHSISDALPSSNPVGDRPIPSDLLKPERQVLDTPSSEKSRESVIVLNIESSNRKKSRCWN